MRLGERHFRFALLLTVIASMVWGFHALIFHHAPDVFRNPQEDMSYAWYVPLFSLYVLWSERRKIIESIASPSIWGAVATLPFLALGFLGVRGIQIRIEIVAFAGLLPTLAWAFFGRKTAKLVFFPAAFLLFCLPLATFLDIITVHLRLFASSTAYVTLKGFGADILRRGTMLAAADGSYSIDIAEPCSGLRSIFALMALTAAYAYFNQSSWLRRVILFSLSVPLAVVGNVMRILSIVLVAQFASGEFATGFYHDYSGYVVFLVAIVLMVACGEGITRIFESFSKRKNCESATLESIELTADAPKSANRVQLVWVSVFAAAVMAVMAFIASTPKPIVCEAPTVALSELPGFDSETEAISEAELTILPKDTRIEKRRYIDRAGNWFLVSAVIGGVSKSSIHRPELCLPSQGFLMTAPQTLVIDGVKWRNITLDGGVNAPSFGFAYTFFNQAGFRTSSHTERIFKDVWDRSILNRIDRWVMITVNSSVSDSEQLKEFLSKLKEMMR